MSDHNNPAAAKTIDDFMQQRGIPRWGGGGEGQPGAGPLAASGDVGGGGGCAAGAAGPATRKRKRDAGTLNLGGTAPHLDP
jgi:hypothetical protein